MSKLSWLIQIFGVEKKDEPTKEPKEAPISKVPEVMTTRYLVVDSAGNFVARIKHTTEHDVLLHAKLQWGVQAEFTEIEPHYLNNGPLPTKDLDLTQYGW